MIWCESNGIFSSTFVDLETPYQGHLLKNMVSVRDSAINTIEHVQEVICREYDGIAPAIRSFRPTFGAL